MKLTPGTGEKKSFPEFLAAHDSATGMLMALSCCLKGEAFEGLGAVPTNEFYASLINSIPKSWRKKLYSLSGEFSATSFKKINKIDASRLDEWVCNSYPERKYPAIAIGSSNGAMIHLCAAMGIPWLPQTFLIPIDKKGRYPVDEPKKTMLWAREPAVDFLKNNTGWQLHHMMDPNQDRLRVGNIGYFRVKKTELGKNYERFINDRLASDGKILLIDCNYKWPVKKIEERHYFQFGGAGGLSPEEYYRGSRKVEQFLQRVHPEIKKWDAPTPDGEAPEAEWGFEKDLLKDLFRFCQSRNICGYHLSFKHPQDLSNITANIFRRWYGKTGETKDRLLVETFNLIAPYLSLQKQCIPYWLFFNSNTAASDLKEYLEKSPQYKEIYMMILSHGKYSEGTTPISGWKDLMQKANEKSTFLGTNPEEYPVDMAVYSRYTREIKKKIPDDVSGNRTLPVENAIELLKKYGAEKISLTNF